MFLSFVKDKIMPNGRKRRKVLLKCYCGNEFETYWESFSCSQLKSCGCYQKIAVANAAHKRGDPLRRHPLYIKWENIKSRCFDINNKKYGGRGIKICDEWVNNYHNFYNWAIENGYASNLEIDRIDFNGNYEPNNCRWVTREMNGNNKRNNIFVVVSGEKMGLRRACRILGKNYKIVWDRIFKLKWDFETAINKPIRKINA